jgi:hypothetical protein
MELQQRLHQFIEIVLAGALHAHRADFLGATPGIT